MYAVYDYSTTSDNKKIKALSVKETDTVTTVSLPLTLSSAGQSSFRLPEWKRDPFAGPSWIKASVNLHKGNITNTMPADHRWILSAISAGSAGAVAIINDSIVQPGSYIRGYRVLQIDKNGVILQSGKSTIRLRLDIPKEQP